MFDPNKIPSDVVWDSEDWYNEEEPVEPSYNDDSRYAWKNDEHDDWDEQ